MKFTIALAALVSLAAATPLDASSTGCKPGTYSCTPDKTGWQVCDVNGKYVAAGVCPPKTSCVFYKPSGSPYCVPPGFKFPKA
ncbi:uncharacterized protein FFB20_08694 [Fusarium fujikuroi]|uniref:Uncharacterized protein n=2 Tax=Fusarium fujikuroi TaxID=5127 RepID=S0DKX4_GIBF5|nr:uncharacterized protein FFUJ_00360 [Fusarium fujikuroi IMI 58289]KLO84992.1 uncharacterized protein LW93_2877 [Fusarium fujikuroi]KLP00681.1 uncharacterized protein Y057_289 [Fusarium fujikuroi]KLP14034.1 uncharacterized protein LW94_10896 [Fusarium fujikuroi]QGI59510.1 hypothetical protein CEK27_001635 [Fusarium fujikuroi]QGI76713.1 hypothetical protein CEK25_001619 [Fusarium fujikuroi]